jgi:hypothetical protein
VGHHIPSRVSVNIITPSHIWIVPISKKFRNYFNSTKFIDGGRFLWLALLVRSLVLVVCNAASRTCVSTRSKVVHNIWIVFIFRKLWPSVTIWQWQCFRKLVTFIHWSLLGLFVDVRRSREHTEEETWKSFGSSALLRSSVWSWRSFFTFMWPWRGSNIQGLSGSVVQWEYIMHGVGL